MGQKQSGMYYAMPRPPRWSWVILSSNDGKMSLMWKWHILFILLLALSNLHCARSGSARSAVANGETDLTKYGCSIAIGLLDAIDVMTLFDLDLHYLTKVGSHMVERASPCESSAAVVNLSGLSLDEIADIVGDKISLADLKDTEHKLVGTFLDLRSLTVLPARGSFDVPAQLTVDLRSLNDIIATYSDPAGHDQLSLLPNYTVAALMKTRLLFAKMSFYVQSAQADPVNLALWQKNVETVFIDLKTSTSEHLAFIDNLRSNAVNQEIARLFVDGKVSGGVQDMVFGYGFGTVLQRFIDVRYQATPIGAAEMARIKDTQRDPAKAPLPLIIRMHQDLVDHPLRLVVADCGQGCEAKLDDAKAKITGLYNDRLRHMHEELDTLFQKDEITRFNALLHKLQDGFPSMEASIQNLPQVVLGQK